MSGSPIVLNRLARKLVAEEAAAWSDGDLLERFVAIKDPNAFSALVERHGPMVLGICKRAIGDSDLADDAFQAVFMVLARRAKSVRNRGSLAGWLFGTARQVSRNAVRAKLRRRRHEQQAIIMPTSDAPHPWDDLLRVLDEELHRLPECYRQPLIACYLRGRTQDEAARDIGWSLSTLRRRLDKAREILRIRMERRGATLSAGLFAGALAPAAMANVPAALQQQTVAATIADINGESISGFAAELAKESTAMTITSKLILAAGIIAATCGIVLAMGQLEKPRPANGPAIEPVAAKPQPSEAPKFVRMGNDAWRHYSAHQLAFTVDGKKLISAGSGFIRLWDVETGAQVQHFGGRFGVSPLSIDEAAFLPDGKTAIYSGTASAERKFAGVAGILNLEKWEHTPLPDLESAPEDRLRLLQPLYTSPDGKMVARLDNRLNIWVWDRKTGKVLHKLEGAVTDKVRDTAAPLFTPDSKYLLTHGDVGKIHVYDLSRAS
jgi:RNA polymerase sigma factor (sigma-70 family)